MLPSSSPAPTAGSSALVWLPLALIGAFFAFLAVPRVATSPGVHTAFVGVGLALLGWQLLLWIVASRRGTPLRVELGKPSPQHYIQTCVQLCLYAYWGFYWRAIYEQAPLILAQLVFLFAFDALFAWSRGRAWRLATGPAPIVLSTNLFIWFRDEWFHWQFAMIVVGLLGKEFVKWQKEGRAVHVFNPSGFGLFVTAIVLLALGNTEQVTHALPLANTIDSPPAIYLVLFCLGVVVQHFFAVTLMTFCAALTTIAVNLAYHFATGTWLFLGSNLPAAGFLGLHLLMTDPSTSPRTHLGRALFGIGYGLGYCASFELLGALGAPTLYAKLFPVPVLNTTVQWLDRLATSGCGAGLERAWAAATTPRRLNAVHMAAWAAVFFTMLGTGYVQAPHEGASIGFWKQAFAEHRLLAGHKLLVTIGARAEQHDPEANNERGIVAFEGKAIPIDAATARRAAARWFATALGDGSRYAAHNLLLVRAAFDEPADPGAVDAACRQLQTAAEGGDVAAAFVLGLASETGRGRPRDGKQAIDLYRRCGDSLFARKGLARLVLGAGALLETGPIVDALTRAADRDAEAGWLLAHLYAAGRGVSKDEPKARELLQRAGTLGLARAQTAAAAQPLAAYAPLAGDEMVLPPFATAFPPR